MRQENEIVRREVFGPAVSVSRFVAVGKAVAWDYTAVRHVMV
jgi:hypothetical protein